MRAPREENKAKQSRERMTEWQNSLQVYSAGYKLNPGRNLIHLSLLSKVFPLQSPQDSGQK